MGVNSTPHFAPSEYSQLRTGGSLKDGWSFIVPPDAFVLDAEVSIGFQDELEQHVREQTEALKSLYLGGTGKVKRSESQSQVSFRWKKWMERREDTRQFVL